MFKETLLSDKTVVVMDASIETKQKVLRCSSSTDANKLAGSIHSIYQENPDTEIILRVIGAGSLNQATKAAIISNKFFAKKGIVVATQPYFQYTEADITAIELKLLFLKK